MTAHAASHVYFGLNAMWVSTCVLAITYATIMSEKVNRAIVALVGAGVMILVGVLDQDEAIKGIDWNTIGLFVVVHGVDVGGLLTPLANKLVAATGGNMAHAGYAILWASAFLSAIVDNIPFVATMIPLIKSMAPAYGGADHIEPLWWCLSLGACLGGNGTLIGASANLTVAGIGERNEVPFKFITYTLYAFPMMVVHVAICHVYIWWRYF
jgi:Na+/H+ antiporter NhaD/arsenite permease-like protein